MYNNIGGKIKGLAKFICWLGIIASVGGGVTMFIVAGNMYSYYQTPYILGGIGIIIMGSIFAWLGSLLVYGFGELIVRAESIDRKIGAVAKESVRPTKAAAPKSAQPAAKPAAKPVPQPAAKPTVTPAVKPAAKPAATPAAKPDQPPKAAPEPVPTAAAQKEFKPLNIVEFLAAIGQTDSMVDIWNLWRGYKVDSSYYEVQDYIRKNKDQEQLHGKLENIEEIKSTIAEMLGR